MQTLKAFYKAYAAWLDAGAPEDEPFTGKRGLCGNLSRFTDNNHRALREMIDQFDDAGLDWKYPFDQFKFTYANDGLDGILHLNHARVAWVRKHAVD